MRSNCGYLRHFALAAVLACAVIQHAYAQDRWVAAWATPLTIVQSPDGGPSFPGGGRLVEELHNQTIRMTARVSIGGSRFRIRLRNAFGATAVTVSAARAAIRTEGSAIDPSSDR